MPLGKETYLEVKATDATNYQWMNDGVKIGGETNPRIAIPRQNNTGTYVYQVEVIGFGGEKILSDLVVLEVFSISDRLGAPDLDFRIDDLESKLYTGMIPDIGPGIRLKIFGQLGSVNRSEPYYDAPETLYLDVSGPTFVSFKAQGNIRAGGFSSDIYNSPPATTDHPGIWRDGVLDASGNGTQTMEFMSSSIPVNRYGEGILAYFRTTPTLPTSLEEASDLETVGTIYPIADYSNGDHPEAMLAQDNYWHGTSENSRDGVDALRIVTPDTGRLNASVSFQTQGPLELSFWSRASGALQNGTLSYRISDLDRAQSVFNYGARDLDRGNLPLTSDWTEHKIRVSTYSRLGISINLEESDPGILETWLDQFSLSYDFPLEYEPLPETLMNPVGTTGFLRIQATGDQSLGTQWVLDGEALPSHFTSSVSLSADEPGTKVYSAIISDSTGSIPSNTTTVRFFSLNQALDNDELEFDGRDNLAGNYTELLVEGEAAPDGEDALSMNNVTTLHDPFDLKTTNRISTVIDGPAVLSYVGTPMAITVNGQPPDTAYKEPIGDSGYVLTTVPISDDGRNHVHWYNNFSAGVFPPAILDQVKVSSLELSEFNLWALEYYSPEEINEAGDTLGGRDGDFDGLTNDEERLFQSNPRAPNGNLSCEIVVIDGLKYPAIRYNRHEDTDPATIILERSTKMKIWEVAETAEEVLAENNGILEVLIRDTLALGDEKRFIRLVVSDDQPTL